MADEKEDSPSMVLPGEDPVVDQIANALNEECDYEYKKFSKKPKATADAPKVISEAPKPTIPIGQPIISDMDFKNLRLNSSPNAPSQKLFTSASILVKRPGSQHFFRVRAGDEWYFACKVIELKEEGELYLVLNPLWLELARELKNFGFYMAITETGILHIVPVRLPDDSGNWNKYAETLQQAIELAKTKWVRAIANRDVGSYEIVQAIHAYPEPEWPETVALANEGSVKLTMEVLLNIAFKERVIRDMNHPVVKKLLGLQ